MDVSKLGTSYKWQFLCQFCVKQQETISNTIAINTLELIHFLNTYANLWRTAK